MRSPHTTTREEPPRATARESPHGAMKTQCSHQQSVYSHASPTQCTWVWVSSRSWWWTGKPRVLQSMESQRVRHDWATGRTWTDYPWYTKHLRAYSCGSQPVINFALHGTFSSTQRYLHDHNRGQYCWVETTEVANSLQPTGQLFTTKNYLVSNLKSDEAKKSYSLGLLVDPGSISRN